MKYKKFNVEYNRVKLLSLFNSSEKQSDTNFISAVGYSTDLLPCIDIFSKELHPAEHGLSEISIAEEMHTKPNNNGLFVFPITGSILLEFEDGEKFIIDTPIAINGKEAQRLAPARAPSIFFAIKIPVDIAFEDAISLLP
jgi:hypothetical protein